MCDLTILLVDNKANVLASNKDYLETEGFKVLTAETEEQALKYYQEEIVHVAVIDVRLLNDSNEMDESGLQLAAHLATLDDSIPRITLTGHTFSDPEAAFRRMFEPNTLGDSLAVRFVRKSEGPEKVLDVIRQVLHTQYGLDSHPVIKMQKGFSWSMMVDQLKTYRDCDNQPKKKAERILEDLTCRLFNKASTVNFLRAVPGLGQCTVALVQQTWDGVPGTILAVKFGPRQNIEQEQLNYQNFVEPFVERRARLELGPVRSCGLAAIAYSFVGKEAASVKGFLDYYEEEENLDQIRKVLTYLFQESCRNWYGGKRWPTEHEQKPLDQLYRSYVNLDDEEHISELKQQLSQLMRQLPRNSSIELLGEDRLRVTFAGRKEIILPNPIWFAFEQYDSKSGNTFFPLPTQMAITHGDLHSGNIVVGDSDRAWLIEFSRTGWGHVLRDFCQLESEIKFDLLPTESFDERYDLEQSLLAPESLIEPLSLTYKSSAQQMRALAAIQHIRKLACQLTDIEDVRDYFTGLLFHALKRISGDRFADNNGPIESARRYHALLSAALICKRLQDVIQAQSRPSVFLSYVAEDTKLVNDFYYRLSAAGYKPWMDRLDILPGEQWERSIERAIENSPFFIACLSRQAVGKRGTLQREIKQALGYKGSGGQIIPVMLERCSLPKELSRYDAIDLSNNYDRWSQLLDALQKRVKPTDITSEKSVFLTYAVAQRNWVGKLRTALEQQDITVWANLDDVASPDWSDKVERELRQAQAIVLLVEPHSEPDNLQRRIWQIALEVVWSDPGKKIIPFLLHDAEAPDFVRASVSIDEELAVIRAKDPHKDWEQAVNDLVAILQQQGDVNPSELLLSNESTELGTDDLTTPSGLTVQARLGLREGIN